MEQPGAITVGSLERKATRLCRACISASQSGLGCAQVVSGNRAGAKTILLDTDGVHADGESLTGELQPTFIADSLDRVRQLLKHEFHVQPPSSSQ